MKIYCFRLFWGQLFLSLQEEKGKESGIQNENTEIFIFLSTLMVERNKYQEIYGAFVLQSERIKKKFLRIIFVSELLSFLFFGFHRVFTSGKWTRFEIVMLCVWKATKFHLCFWWFPLFYFCYYTGDLLSYENISSLTHLLTYQMTPNDICWI